MVAAIDRQYVESDRRFQVVQVCKSGGQALEYLAKQDVELIVLDYYTPEMNGQEFLDRLHAMGRAPAVFMVTSASDKMCIRDSPPFGPVPPGSGGSGFGTLGCEWSSSC